MRLSVVVILALGLSACGSGIAPDDCDPSLPATGEKRLVAHPDKPSECRLVVMKCNACAYDGEGKLLGVESDYCGVCIGADF